MLLHCKTSLFQHIDLVEAIVELLPETVVFFLVLFLNLFDLFLVIFSYPLVLLLLLACQVV